MNQTPVQVRRKFAETFKREAVNNWLVSRKSADVIAQELAACRNIPFMRLVSHAAISSELNGTVG